LQTWHEDPVPSHVRWCSKPVAPDSYDDVAALVRLARKARSGVVEFDWVFSEADLRRLQRCVSGWSSGVVGRYRCFDARVLAAIASGLREPDTALLVIESRNSEGRDDQVACTREGDMYHLRGRATFDLVYRYALSPDDEWAKRLGETARRSIADTVGRLGWDRDRLSNPRFRAVVNVMFGNRADYGISSATTSAGPAATVKVPFQGPLSAVDGARSLSWK